LGGAFIQARTSPSTPTDTPVPPAPAAQVLPSDCGGFYDVSGKSSLKLTGLPAGAGYVVTVYVTAGGSGVEGMWVETRS